MKEVPAFYQYLQFKVGEYLTHNNIDQTNITQFLFRGYNLPKKLREVILLEMQTFGLIKVLPSDKLTIINCPFESEFQLKSNLGRRKKAIKKIVKAFN